MQRVCLASESNDAGKEIEQQRDVVRTALDKVVARTAIDVVSLFTAEEAVVAGTAFDAVVALPVRTTSSPPLVRMMLA